jgi:hypothetical protein
LDPEVTALCLDSDDERMREIGNKKDVKKRVKVHKLEYKNNKLKTEFGEDDCLHTFTSESDHFATRCKGIFKLF